VLFVLFFVFLRRDYILIIMEETLILLKPDACDRGLVGPIISRLLDKGLTLEIAIRHESVDLELVKAHYDNIKNEPYFEKNCEFVSKGPVIAMTWSGENAISVVRQLLGNRKTPGTIRGDYCNHNTYNLMHASDAPETAKAEIELWFNKEKQQYDTNTIKKE
jgi:nucleoside-diphosphate kinase